MPNQILWIAPTARTSGISAATLPASTGNNLVGSEIDNEANLDRFLDLELTWTASTVNTANQVVEVYLLYSLDGAAYESGSTTTDPKKSPVGFFVDDGTTNAQIQVVSGIRLRPFKFKILLKSELTYASTTNGTTLDAETYNEEIQ